MTNELELTEYQEQCMVVRYLEFLKASGKVRLFTAVPQNMWTKSIQQKIKTKNEGVRKGFPDMVIVFNDSVLFLEMKRRKKGVVRDEQWEWLKSLADKKTQTAVCKGFDEAKTLIDSIIKDKE